MPRRKKTAAESAETPAATIEAPTALPDPFAERLQRAKAAVNTDLARFAAKQWPLRYDGEPTIIGQARALFISSLFAEQHAPCPHCGAQTGPRLTETEASARFLELQHLLLDREWQDAVLKADLHSLNGVERRRVSALSATGATGGAVVSPLRPRPARPAARRERRQMARTHRQRNAPQQRKSA